MRKQSLHQTQRKVSQNPPIDCQLDSGCKWAELSDSEASDKSDMWFTILMYLANTTTLISGADSWQNISLVDKSTKFGMLVPYLAPE